MGALHGLPDRDGYLTHHWDYPGGGGGTAQYWRRGEPAPTGPMPPNPYPEYRRGFDAGFWPGIAQGWHHGYNRGAFEGYERGVEDAWGTGAVHGEYARGYDHAWPMADNLGYESAYDMMDTYNMDGYDDHDGYGYEYNGEFEGYY